MFQLGWAPDTEILVDIDFRVHGGTTSSVSLGYGGSMFAFRWTLMVVLPSLLRSLGLGEQDGGALLSTCQLSYMVAKPAAHRRRHPLRGLQLPRALPRQARRQGLRRGLRHPGHRLRPARDQRRRPRRRRVLLHVDRQGQRQRRAQRHLLLRVRRLGEDQLHPRHPRDRARAAPGPRGPRQPHAPRLHPAGRLSRAPSLPVRNVGTSNCGLPGPPGGGVGAARRRASRAARGGRRSSRSCRGRRCFLRERPGALGRGRRSPTRP